MTLQANHDRSKRNHLNPLRLSVNNYLINDLEFFPALLIPILCESEYYDLLVTAYLSGSPEAKPVLAVTDLVDSGVRVQDTCEGLGRPCWLTTLRAVHED